MASNTYNPGSSVTTLKRAAVLLLVVGTLPIRACHNSCKYAQPVEAPSASNNYMQLPWWGYCAPQFNRDRNFDSPPPGGTRYYVDTQSQQDYKTCGDSGRPNWNGAEAPYAVCCNGDTGGTRSEGNHDQLASCFEVPARYLVGSALHYWSSRENMAHPITQCTNQRCRDAGCPILKLSLEYTAGGLRCLVVLPSNALAPSTVVGCLLCNVHAYTDMG